MNLLTRLSLRLKCLGYFFTPAKAPRYRVLFKMDDLADVCGKVRRLDRIVRAANLKICWGIIGKSLENPEKGYLPFLTSRHASGRYRFFNHGYTHTGAPDYEFFDKPADVQEKSLRRTQDLMRQKTGITLNAFGAPCNHVDQNTALALKNLPEIKFWFYGLDNFGGTVIRRVIDMENGVGNPDFAFFKTQWAQLPKTENMYFTLQGHPYMWGKTAFLQFRCIAAFLKHEGCRFILPEELTGEQHD